MDVQQATPNSSRSRHVYYSPNYRAPPSQTGSPAGPLWSLQTRERLGTVAAAGASISSGYAAVPGPGSPYHLGGFPSGPFPDGHAQPYVGPVQRGYVPHPLSSVSVPSAWSHVAPGSVNVYGAVPGHYSPNMVHVPLPLMQGPTGVCIVTQANYDCGHPFPATALSQPCIYQEFSLSSAMTKDFNTLFRPDEVAFPNVTFNQKVSIRLRVAGCPQYNHQASIPRTGRSRSSPTRATLASLTAREIKRFIDHERDNRRMFVHPAGRLISLDDLCLVEIRHVSCASIQPVIGLVGHF